jgi:hypothetical protein
MVIYLRRKRDHLNLNWWWRNLNRRFLHTHTLVSFLMLWVKS